MTRRRDIAAADDPGLRLMAESFVPVCTLVGKTWALHLEKVTKVSREENLAMIADSVAFLRASGKRVVYDAEHFFDAYRDDPAVRAAAACRRPPSAGAETVALCDTNGSSLPGDVTLATLAVVERFGERVRIGIHTHDDAGCGVANALVAVAARRPPGAGHDERLRRALRQRQPRLDHARRSSSSWASTASRRPAGGAHRDRAPDRRDLQLHAGPEPALRRAATRSRTRAACTSPASWPTRARSSTSTPPPSATTARC